MVCWPTAKTEPPLEIDWNPVFSCHKPSYYYLFDQGDEIDARATSDDDGGWSLNMWGNDHEAEKIAYVLYCYKEITFKDGTAWSNPNYDHWLSQYKGIRIDVDIFE